MILAVAHKATAQGSFVVFEEATRIYSVDNHPGNTYEWAVYNLADINNEITDLNIVEILDGKTDHQAEIKWKKAGDYLLIIREQGICQNLKATKIKVVDNASIALTVFNSIDCYDGLNPYSTPVELKLGAADIDAAMYPITVEYSIAGNGAGNPSNGTATIVNKGELLQISELIEDADLTKEFTIRLTAAKNKYGGRINITAGKEEHIRKVFEQPDINDIVADYMTARMQTVTVTASCNYEISGDAGLKYTWAVKGHPEIDLTGYTNTLAHIDWRLPGTYTLQVYGTAPAVLNNCNTELKEITVQVLPMGTLKFKDDTDHVITCSRLAANKNGGPLDNSEFIIDINGGAGPYTVYYTIRRPDGTLYTVAPVKTKNLTKNGLISILNKFENTTATMESFEVELTKAVTRDGVELRLGTKDERTRYIRVRNKPSLGGVITAN
jgi:hypothetical protein